MRRIRFSLSLLAMLALFASACGGSKTTPLETVQAASTATAQAKTMSIAMTLTGGAGALANTTFTGAFDFDHHLMSMQLDASKLGLPGGSGDVNAVMDFATGAVEYVNIPGLAKEFGGKHWMKIDLSAAMTSVCPGIDIGSLMKVQSGDPTSGLALLAAADKVTPAGTETLHGEKTTHYAVEVNVNKIAANASPEAKATLQKLAGYYTNPIRQADVWLDSSGRAVRVKQTVDTSQMKLPACLSTPQAQATNPFKGAFTMTMDMFDFGKAVKIDVPAASDVADLQQLMNSLHH